MIHNNAMITIEGQQWGADEEPQAIRLTTEGQLYKKNDSWHVAYDESEATGLDGTRTTIRVDSDGTVTLLRSGSHEMEMIFVQGSRHITNMVTPYGNLAIGIYTTRAQSTLGADGGSIHLGYSIDFNQQETATQKLDLEIRLKG
jgi:uncharacterized beta-barrel protein YwiB (DUF1934 family)